jgi:chromosome partitioning protein
LLGLKELLAEIEEIRITNPRLSVLGYLMTLVDPTNVANQTRETLTVSFGAEVFESRIRRSVKLKEAPAFGKTIFHHAPDSAGARDYLGLAYEVMARLGIGEATAAAVGSARPALTVVPGVSHV